MIQAPSKTGRRFFSFSVTRAGKFLLGLLACLALLMVAFFVNRWTSSGTLQRIHDGDIQVLRQAFVGLGPDQASTPEGTAEISLPFRVQSDLKGFTHFRVPFTLPTAPAPDTSWALCVPRWSANPAVWIDGKKRLHLEQGRLHVKALFRPGFVPLPVDLMPGQHRIDIRLSAIPGAFSGLTEIWLGPQEMVMQHCSSLQDMQNGMRMGGLLLMAFITLVAGCVFVAMRDGLSFAFFLTGVAWCMHTLVVLDGFGPVQDNTWIALFITTRPLTGFMGIFVALRLINQKYRQLHWLALALALTLISYGVFLLLPVSQWQAWLWWTGVMLTILTLVMCIFLLWTASAKSNHLSDFAFAMTLFFGVGVGALDIGRAIGWLPYSTMSMSHWTAPLLSLAIGLLVIERLVRYLRYKTDVTQPP